MMLHGPMKRLRGRMHKRTGISSQFTLRHGSDPRICVTTTPKPIKPLRDLLAQEGKGVVVTRGSTLDNAATWRRA
jgi:phage terminase large subunit-like protein